MTMQSVLDDICLLLETYKGRDKILRTISYITKLIGGLNQNEQLAKKLLIFSTKISGARATLRLLDDIPMLQYTIQYGLGKNEPDRFLAQLGVLTNVIDQIYYPIEKISWLAENKLISGIDNDKWDTASSVCWVLSIYLTLLNAPLENILRMQKYEMLSFLRMSVDFLNAVNTLPPGFLWSSKLKTWHVGLIGTISSLLGIYQIFYKRTLK